jgi:hypothetical protein
VLDELRVSFFSVIAKHISRAHLFRVTIFLFWNKTSLRNSRFFFFPDFDQDCSKMPVPVISDASMLCGVVFIYRCYADDDIDFLPSHSVKRVQLIRVILQCY